MTDAEILTAVKTALFGSAASTYQDDVIAFYIADVEAFMVDAGVPADKVKTAASVGCIARGVSDLWNYGSGDVKFSEHFKQRVIQLALGGAG